MNEHQQPQRPSLWKKLAAPFVALLVILGKFKGLATFLPFLLKTGGTMVISIAIYAFAWGWWFALGFVLLLLVHECGHLVAARWCGLNVGLPVFIPFMGAVIALKDAPRNAWIEAQVGIGGPLLGTAGALVCWMIYDFTREPIFLVLAYSGFWLNLFNLIPIVPFDGGRIVTAISPWLWVIGLPLMVWVLMQSSWNLFLLLIVGLSLPRVISLFRRRSEAEQRFYELAPNQRLLMSGMYFGLAAMLGYAMHLTHAQIEWLRAGGL